MLLQVMAELPRQTLKHSVLAASIVGKCHFCVKAHYETLKQEGYTVEQLRDIGRIANHYVRDESLIRTKRTAHFGGLSLDLGITMC
jgi:AhpD family alkylhydroperoxidase